MTGAMRADLPGHDLIEQGLDDLAAGVETAAALLVSIGAPRLGQLGISVANPIPSSEHRLYALSSRSDPIPRIPLQRADQASRELRAGAGTSQPRVGRSPAIDPAAFRRAVERAAVRT